MPIYPWNLKFHGSLMKKYEKIKVFNHRAGNCDVSHEIKFFFPASCQAWSNFQVVQRLLHSVLLIFHSINGTFHQLCLCLPRLLPQRWFWQWHREIDVRLPRKYSWKWRSRWRCGGKNHGRNSFKRFDKGRCQIGLHEQTKLHENPARNCQLLQQPGGIDVHELETCQHF